MPSKKSVAINPEFVKQKIAHQGNASGDDLCDKIVGQGQEGERKHQRIDSQTQSSGDGKAGQGFTVGAFAGKGQMVIGQVVGDGGKKIGRTRGYYFTQ